MAGGCYVKIIVSMVVIYFVFEGPWPDFEFFRPNGHSDLFKHSLHFGAVGLQIV